MYEVDDFFQVSRLEAVGIEAGGFAHGGGAFTCAAAQMVSRTPFKTCAIREEQIGPEVSLTK